MTRKDYTVFARAIRDLRRRSTYDAHGFAIIRVSELESALADIFATDNARFSRERFFAACGRGDVMPDKGR